MANDFTDHELIAMTQQYTISREGKYVTHEAYEEINRQVAGGRPWSKCMDCGNPFPLDKEGASMEFCSAECGDRYSAYLADSLHQDILDYGVH